MAPHDETSARGEPPVSFLRSTRRHPRRTASSSRAAARCSGRRRARLHLESLEPRLLPTAASLADLVSAGWFQDLSSPDVSAHAGAPSLAASSIGSQHASSILDPDTHDWIVRFSEEAATDVSSVAGTASLLAGSGVEFEVLRGLGLVGQVLVRSTGASAEVVQDVLASNVAVAAFERDELQQFQTIPDDPLWGQLWGLENTGQGSGVADADIDAAAAWGISTGSRDVVVAVVDTGIDWRHADLADNIWTNSGEIAGNGIDDDGNGFADDVHGYNFAGNSGDPADDNGHGTHVAGTIAAVGGNGVGVTGVSWSASIMALKFLAADGSGYTSDAVRAIHYAALQRLQYGVNVRVINMSWGGGGFSESLQAAIRAAGEAGILCVAAAGNNAKDNDTASQYPSNYDAANLIAVAATDRSDHLATFSNYGTTTVDLAAPGVSILSTYPNNRYVSLSGTSMATPHVAGVAALAWSVAPEATVAEIRSAILDGVDRLSGLSGKVATGGRLNAYNTLRLLEARAVHPPKIASLAASPASLTAGTVATLTARGVSDPDGNLAGVWFYQDSNGNGQWDSSDRVLGGTTTIAGQQATLSLATTGFAAGTYQVFARAKDTGGLWSAAVAATFTVLAPDDFGDNAASAASACVGSTLSGRIETGGDRDWVKFRATAGQKITFTTQLTTLQDSVLTLYDRNGTTVLARNDDAPGLGLASEIRWTAPASGTYYLEVKAYSGRQTGAYSLTLGHTVNTAPTLAALSDRTMPLGQDSITVSLRATDAEGDRLTFTAAVLPSNTLPGQAYDLDQRLGLYTTGNYLQNLRGSQEKWLRGSGGTSYYILPNGELHLWTGSMRSSPLLATLNADYWANPRLLHDARPAALGIPADAVTLSLQGSVLTIRPRSGLAGEFLVRVTVSDGVSTDTETFKVTVTSTGPQTRTANALPMGLDALAGFCATTARTAGDALGGVPGSGVAISMAFLGTPPRAFATADPATITRDWIAVDGSLSAGAAAQPDELPEAAGMAAMEPNVGWLGRREAIARWWLAGASRGSAPGTVAQGLDAYDQPGDEERPGPATEPIEDLLPLLSQRAERPSGLKELAGRQ